MVAWSPRRVLAPLLATVALFILVRALVRPSRPLQDFAKDRTSIEQLQKAGTLRTTGSLTPLELTGSKLAPGLAKSLRREKQVPFSDVSRKPLRLRLDYYYPYDVRGKFPAYIWQTWRYTPAMGEFTDYYRQLEASWTTQHPGFVHEVITDEAAVSVIRHLYSALPDVVAAYEILPRAVLKADFFRYLILLARGGIYTDIDTWAIRSAVDWVPQTLSRDMYGLVIGIEADADRPDWEDWYSRRVQFCQWTIQAKPGHPVLREVVAHITEKILSLKRDGRLREIVDSHSTVELTGPAVWTDVIFSYFNDARFFDMKSEPVTNITWEHFTGITSQKRVGDVVVLPITAFSPGINTMGAGGDDDEMAMVKHYFEGNWKPEKERHIGDTE